MSFQKISDDIFFKRCLYRLVKDYNLCCSRHDRIFSARMILSVPSHVADKPVAWLRDVAFPCIVRWFKSVDPAKPITAAVNSHLDAIRPVGNYFSVEFVFTSPCAIIISNYISDGSIV